VRFTHVCLADLRGSPKGALCGAHSARICAASRASSGRRPPPRAPGNGARFQRSHHHSCRRWRGRYFDGAQPVRVDAQRRRARSGTRTLHQLLLWCREMRKRRLEPVLRLIFPSSFARCHASPRGAGATVAASTADGQPPAAVGFAPPGATSISNAAHRNKRNRGWRTPSLRPPESSWSFPSGTSHILRAPHATPPTTRDRLTYWSNPRTTATCPLGAGIQHKRAATASTVAGDVPSAFELVLSRFHFHGGHPLAPGQSKRIVLEPAIPNLAGQSLRRHDYARTSARPRHLGRSRIFRRHVLFHRVKRMQFDFCSFSRPNRTVPS